MRTTLCSPPWTTCCSTDLVGQLDDGAFYVLFPQATTDRMPAIEARFNQNGLRCEVVSEDVAVG